MHVALDQLCVFGGRLLKFLSESSDVVPVVLAFPESTHPSHPFSLRGSAIRRSIPATCARPSQRRSHHSGLNGLMRDNLGDEKHCQWKRGWCIVLLFSVAVQRFDAFCDVLDITTASPTAIMSSFHHPCDWLKCDLDCAYGCADC